MEHPQSQFNPPSRSELSAISLFGATEEERQIAQRLITVTPEDKDPEHPLLTLDRLFPLGSEADRLAKLSPMGAFIEDMISSLPEELGQPDDYPVMVNSERPSALETEAPESKSEPVSELGESMKRLAGLQPPPSGPTLVLPQQMDLEAGWGFGDGSSPLL